MSEEEKARRIYTGRPPNLGSGPSDVKPTGREPTAQGSYVPPSPSWIRLYAEPSVPQPETRSTGERISQPLLYRKLAGEQPKEAPPRPRQLTHGEAETVGWTTSRPSSQPFTSQREFSNLLPTEQEAYLKTKGEYLKGESDYLSTKSTMLESSIQTYNASPSQGEYTRLSQESGNLNTRISSYNAQVEEYNKNLKIYEANPTGYGKNLLPQLGAGGAFLSGIWFAPESYRRFSENLLGEVPKRAQSSDFLTKLSAFPYSLGGVASGAAAGLVSFVNPSGLKFETKTPQGRVLAVSEGIGIGASFIVGGSAFNAFEKSVGISRLARVPQAAARFGYGSALGAGQSYLSGRNPLKGGLVSGAMFAATPPIISGVSRGIRATGGLIKNPDVYAVKLSNFKNRLPDYFSPEYRKMPRSLELATLPVKAVPFRYASAPKPSWMIKSTGFKPLVISGGGFKPSTKTNAFVKKITYSTRTSSSSSISYAKVPLGKAVQQLKLIPKEEAVVQEINLSKVATKTKAVAPTKKIEQQALSFSEVGAITSQSESSLDYGFEVLAYPKSASVPKLKSGARLGSVNESSLVSMSALRSSLVSIPSLTSTQKLVQTPKAAQRSALRTEAIQVERLQLREMQVQELGLKQMTAQKLMPKFPTPELTFETSKRKRKGKKKGFEDYLRMHRISENILDEDLGGIVD